MTSTAWRSMSTPKMWSTRILLRSVVVSRQPDPTASVIFGFLPVAWDGGSFRA